MAIFRRKLTEPKSYFKWNVLKRLAKICSGDDSRRFSLDAIAVVNGIGYATDGSMMARVKIANDGATPPEGLPPEYSIPANAILKPVGVSDETFHVQGNTIVVSQPFSGSGKPFPPIDHPQIFWIDGEIAANAVTINFDVRLLKKMFDLAVSLGWKSVRFSYVPNGDGKLEVPVVVRRDTKESDGDGPEEAIVLMGRRD